MRCWCVDTLYLVVVEGWGDEPRGPLTVVISEPMWLSLERAGDQ